MKVRFYSAFLALAGVVLLMGLACSTSAATPTLKPTAKPTERPTKTRLPATQRPAPTATEAPVQSPIYFTEEFDSGIPDWSYFVQNGDESLMDLSADSGSLSFNLNGEDLYVYVMYDPWTYDNVRVDATADNRGKNSNSVSLICRYSESDGWYEFNIGNDGLWQVFVYDIATGGDYQMLNSGGSTAIHSGKAVNEYSAICNGTTLSLYINGTKATSFQETYYSLREGLVGVGVSSYQALPIIVNVDKVSISEP